MEVSNKKRKVRLGEPPVQNLANSPTPVVLRCDVQGCNFQTVQKGRLEQHQRSEKVHTHLHKKKNRRQLLLQAIKECGIETMSEEVLLRGVGGPEWKTRDIVTGPPHVLLFPAADGSSEWRASEAPCGWAQKAGTYKYHRRLDGGDFCFPQEPHGSLFQEMHERCQKREGKVSSMRVSGSTAQQICKAYGTPTGAELWPDIKAMKLTADTRTIHPCLIPTASEATAILNQIYKKEQDDKKKAGKPAGKPRKCGHCRVEGHTKPKCPQINR